MANVVGIECPRCHSGSAEVLGGNHYRCSHCQQLFMVEPTRSQPASPPPIAGPRPAGSSAPLVDRASSQALKIAGLLALVGALVLGVIGVGLFFLVPKNPPRRLSTPVSVAVVKPASETAPEPPRAELIGTLQGRSRSGALYWLNTYRNVGIVPIERPAVVLSAFDSAGQRVNEASGWSPMDLVLPGESVPVLVLWSQPVPFVRTEVRPRDPRAASPRMLERRIVLSVREHRMEAGTLRRIIGTVVNPDGRAACFAKIVAKGISRDGRLVSLQDAFASDRRVEPGRETGFSMFVSSFEIEPPQHYELSAHARACE